MEKNTAPELIYEKRGHIATITLNRPEKLNAFSVNMIRNWVEALKEAQADDTVRVIVLTGAGRAFCAGGDIKAMASGAGFFPESDFPPAGRNNACHKKRSLWELIHRVPLTLEDIDKPVIAAVNGDAIGAGCDMALMCDLRLAAEEARFSEGYVKLGLVPGDGGAYFLPRLVGLAKALELLWTGEMISAREAYRIGLVNRVAPGEKLLAETYCLADRIAAGPPLAVRMIKRAVYQGLKTDLRTSLDLISSHMAIITETADHQEGVEALLEGRKPDFKGK
ncbi:enoyl-CoA hydratase/isomerase family protein [Desulfotomaculum copahuensis]|uniref:Enoyl-CoA hydratase n=1 Tax=Desulfotomaculum copahuensis TaxID=1838280 RepID=A0A1B7LGQ7_9FIRM|nr:enoyl-CoA hydratase-related protein [Desulfotomaculum copahuensis]OAT85287.1 enoyl-CoA hydratase [Desulfotomaculum copahuensis]